ncbi:putative cysteine dioxygenase Cdo1 [Protomyces lactucae-debilis]|uniref:Cysteine dioxygenase n=1 Tax=Protomyces lactucae-debilis TaxID=2754530 RepID=A0A1Y2F121_PROLT|nr:putative cysteine dioxygenase Cdo1 [Protomyces lactucae-debilis]ORY77407.1 putative cysteine dioxygenase Cdo1 [Protomyces lactucae-debilis]
MSIDRSVKQNPFQQLVADIHSCLGADAGIDTSDAHLQQLQQIMHDYTSCESDWIKYALEEPTRSYTRNLVSNVNGKANLLVLVWNPRRQSPAHCHSSAHCLMKVLKGTLNETLYAWPRGAKPMEPGKPQEATQELDEHENDEDEDGEGLQVTRITDYDKDQVAYINDALGVHRISNQTDEIAVSLHLYTPPWASKYGCQIFDERTGHAHRVAQCGFYSVDGIKCV